MKKEKNRKDISSTSTRIIDTKNGFVFVRKDIKQFIDEKIKLSCYICFERSKGHNPRVFDSEKNLREHYRVEHRVEFCDLCV